MEEWWAIITFYLFLRNVSFESSQAKETITEFQRATFYSENQTNQISLPWKLPTLTQKSNRDKG